MLFSLPALRQVAALPFVPLGRGAEILLITSRKPDGRPGRWILPKGWPEKGAAPAETACEEALEEAGIVGRAGATPLGSYATTKTMPQGYDVDCHIHVYPLLVVEQRLSWKEETERNRRWVPLADAADCVDDNGLADFLKTLAREQAHGLDTLARRLCAPEPAAPVQAGALPR